MDVFAAVGLGLDYDALQVQRTTESWLAVGSELRDRVAVVLDGVAAGVEVIGSSSVLALLAKPIIDLAVGLDSDQSVAAVSARLAAEEWIYRGDAGRDGGQVWVLETRPWHRVAHLHVVEHDGSQWQNYLQLRDLLRRNPTARARYGAVKLDLAAHCHDRRAYTSGKSDIVAALLRELD